MRHEVVSGWRLAAVAWDERGGGELVGVGLGFAFDVGALPGGGRVVAEEIEGALLGFGVDAADVFTEDAEAEKLDAGHEEHADEGEGPAADPLVGEDADDEGVDDAGEGDEGGAEADKGDDAEGDGGEADNAVDGEGEHFADGVLGGAGVAAGAVVVEADLGIADPAGHAAEEALALGHAAEGVDDAAIDEAEVAGVEGNLDVGEAVDGEVEEAGGPELEGGFAFAGIAYAVDDLGAALPEGDHFGDELGGILEVGIDDDGGAAGDGF